MNKNHRHSRANCGLSYYILIALFYSLFCAINPIAIAQATGVPPQSDIPPIAKPPVKTDVPIDGSVDIGVKVNVTDILSKLGKDAKPSSPPPELSKPLPPPPVPYKVENGVAILNPISPSPVIEAPKTTNQITKAPVKPKKVANSPIISKPKPTQIAPKIAAPILKSSAISAPPPIQLTNETAVLTNNIGAIPEVSPSLNSTSAQELPKPNAIDTNPNPSKKPNLLWIFIAIGVAAGFVANVIRKKLGDSKELYNYTTQVMEPIISNPTKANEENDFAFIVKNMIPKTSFSFVE